jgi:hypothetical protein
MKYTILTILICLLYNCSSNDDLNENNVINVLYDGYDPRLLNYNAVTEQNKQILWNEEFDNNDSKFPVDISLPYGYKNVTIENGILIYNYFLNGPIFHKIPFIINKNNDFEIEVRVLLNNDSQSIVNDIIGFLQGDKTGYVIRYELDEEENGIIGIRHYQQSVSFFINQTDYWNINQFNTITARKIGNKYAVFINHKLLYVLMEKKIIYNSVFIGISQGTNMYDYVRISYITE